jgi:hypothetical protein
MTKIQYQKIILEGRTMKKTFYCLLISLLIFSTTHAGQPRPPIKLTLHPSKTKESASKYQLLPKAEELIDADAAPLYEKALASLPSELNTDQINQWRKTPPEQLPLKQVQAIVQQFKPAYQLLEQAAKCKRCDWTYEALQNLTQYRNMAFLLTLQIRSQIAQGKFDNAVDTIQTGYALAKNLSKEPTLIPGLVAAAITEVISAQIDQFVQSSDSPNLYQALQDLPHPFIDLSSSLEIEQPDNVQRIHQIINRMERHIAALQCIEALRLYAGSHDRKFPDKLSDVTDMKVPDDPVTKKPFSYNRTGSEAVLEVEATEGSEGRDAIRYEIKFKD